MQEYPLPAAQRYEIDGRRLISQFLEFVRVDSPSLAEAPFAQVLMAELSALGLRLANDETGREGAGNILAVLPGNKKEAPPILLVAHMDTVEPGRGIQPQVEEGVIRSDGTTILGSDNKAAIAAALEAVRYLQEVRPAHGDVELLFTWGEERGLEGSRSFDCTSLRSRVGFVPDADGPIGTVVTRAPYHESVFATFHGRAAHAGVEPEKGISAIVTAGRAIARMPLGRIDAETTANIGRISGGMARNIVPETVDIEGEARSADKEKLERQVGLMREAMELAAEEMGARVQIDAKRNYDGFHVADDEWPVRVAVKAARALGLTPHITGTGGGTDANILNAHGIRTIALGIAGEALHSKQEHIAIADLVLLGEYLVSLVVEAANQP
ncbi:MAG: M20/M25/M40 family metallo-hydrolase [Chloroflexota bacterium]